MNDESDPRNTGAEPERALTARVEPKTEIPSSTTASRPSRRSGLSFSDGVQLALLVVTTLYLVVTYNIFRTAREANEMTSRVVAATERAYVECRLVQAADDNPQNFQKLAILIENSGRVPARKVKGRTGWTTVSVRRGQDLKVDLERLPETHRSELSMEIVPAGQMVAAYLDLKAMTPEVAQEITSGTASLMLMVQLDYEDPFAKNYASYGCFVYEPGSRWLSCNFGGDAGDASRSFKIPTRD